MPQDPPLMGGLASPYGHLSSAVAGPRPLVVPRSASEYNRCLDHQGPFARSMVNE